jgi:hypothetical protein
MATLLDENSAFLLDEAGAQLLDEAGGVSSDSYTASYGATYGAPGIVTPATSIFPVQVIVELQINGTWTDISTFVYQRNAIQITGGSTQEGDTPQPATCTMTLDNRDGRFSPNYSLGAYYPYLLRNTKLRVSTIAVSATGNTYEGYRFWGEVPNWPPLADLSGTDVYVTINASGPLRRINQGGGKGSALARYYATLTGTLAPIAYWPCEDDPFTTTIGAGVEGGQDMVITGTPAFKAISDFNGSAPIAVLNNSTWDGFTGSFATSGDDVFGTVGTYYWVAATTTVDCRVWAPGAGADNGFHGVGGGAGEFARDSALAVTVGQTYQVVVKAGGPGGLQKTNVESHGTDAPDMSFAGDAVTVIAHGGKCGSAAAGSGDGGTGSTNAEHHDGGTGGQNAPDYPRGAGGGGASGPGGAAGHNGGDAGPSNPGNGGTGQDGGGAGGKGAIVGHAGAAGIAPGGGGGGGSTTGSSPTFTNYAGGGGATGRIELVYASSNQANANIVRFVLLVPKHGGNNNRVLLRVMTGSVVLNHLDVTYVSGGKLRLRGFNGSNVQQFDSGAQSWNIDNQTVMVSIELKNSGANVAWTFKAIRPGQPTLIAAAATGTVNTAACGNVTEVIAAPNGDITKSAMGHISVQYALVDLRRVSKALDGHQSEMGIDRFIRLANEQALDNEPKFKEQSDHWGFEAGIQGWTPVNSGITTSSVWSQDGAFSLLLTATGEGQPSGTSPTGTAGQPVNPGDVVSVAAEIYAPGGLTNAYVGIKWYTNLGTFVSESDSVDLAIDAATATTLQHKFTAPSTAFFFAITVGDHHSDALGTSLYVDNVRTHPRMGVQTHKEYKAFLEEIKDLDQGILEEGRDLFGLKYRTRIRLLNQNPVLTLDDSAAQLADPRPAPVLDDLLTKNHIVVSRHKGAKVTVTLDNGTMSVKEPPAGTGRYKKNLKVQAEADEQLAALASHLLNLGTVQNERYPIISVNLFRNEVSDQVSAIAGVEIGDCIQIIGLPFWYPSTTTRQLVVGYSETIAQDQWLIQWNCVPESPYEIVVSNIRRW